jgi:hypothetical protein
VGSAVEVFAPAPDFRYVGLEPIRVGQVGVAATAFGLGAGVTLAMSSLDPKHALVAGTLASIVSAFALRNAGASTEPKVATGSARMAIVPWGVLVETEESPRILRWAAVRRIEVVTSRVKGFFSRAALSSRVAVETEHDRFVGEAHGIVPLERLVEHLGAYAEEQSRPLALALEGGEQADAFEPGCEALLDSARGWLESRAAATDLDLPPSGYRRAAAHAASPATTMILRSVLSDRTPKPADPRAFAAVLGAELGATELAPELVTLGQCPHPIVAAVARQAARKLGVPRSKTGTLDEIAPFLWEGDRARLEGWIRG